MRRCVLILVAFHPSHAEVEALKACLDQLSPEISYVVVANDHTPGEAVDSLSEGAELFLARSDNPGYGRAVNDAVDHLRCKRQMPPYLGVLNTDLVWQPGTFEGIRNWLDKNQDVVLAVPRLLDEQGNVQLLCKRNPSLLSLISRRFIPGFLKPRALLRYDRDFVMANQDYNLVFDVQYLSGCCMIMRSKAFLAVGGFDEDFFLYLEDADITRSMSSIGRTVHLPIASIVHRWGRGNHRSIKLTLVNFHSAWVYFRKWGLTLW